MQINFLLYQNIKPNLILIDYTNLFLFVVATATSSRFCVFTLPCHFGQGSIFYTCTVTTADDFFLQYRFFFVSNMFILDLRSCRFGSICFTVAMTKRFFDCYNMLDRSMLYLQASPDWPSRAQGEFLLGWTLTHIKIHLVGQQKDNRRLFGKIFADEIWPDSRNFTKDKKVCV